MPYKNHYDEYRSEFSPGDTVSVRFGGVLRHYGVVTSRGTVISNSRRHGGVVEQPLDVFANGKSVLNHGPDSDHPAYVVEKRARRKLGHSYDLTSSNCIDFVNSANRRKATPWQVGRAAGQALGDMIFGSRRRY